MTAYFSALCATMEMISVHPRAIFMGQAVSCAGTGMSRTLDGVPREKLLEMPVTENLQLGMAIGMSLCGYIPICVYPRINFMLCAMDQLVLHLDAIPRYSDYRPRVIIRTAVATPKPLDPGPQHQGDYTTAFRLMLNTVKVVELFTAAEIGPEYRAAMKREGSTLLIERAEFY